MTTLHLNNAGLKSIGPHVFTGLDNLRDLSLQRNGITSIGTDTFSLLSQLHTLDLSWNYLTSWKRLSGLDNLRSIFLNNNGISHLKTGCFFGLNNLENIDLDMNLLSTFPGRLFDAANNIRNLKLSENLITEIEDRGFYLLHGLRILDLRRNNLPVINESTFTGLNELSVLTLSDNSIIEIANGSFSMLHNVKKLNLDHNMLSGLTYKKLSGGLSSVKRLDLSHNQIKTLYSRTFSSLKNLQWLNLRNNRISKISQNAFVGLSKLAELDLTHNKLTLFKPSENEFADFTGLSNLQLIYLGDNFIRLINPDNFRTFESTLHFLDLSNNELSFIHEDTFGRLPRLNSLFLVGNQMMCSCQYTLMLRSLRTETMAADCFKYSEIQKEEKGLEMELPSNLSDDTSNEWQKWDICGQGCDNSSSMSIKKCKDCAVGPPGTLCANFHPFKNKSVSCVAMHFAGRNTFTGTVGNKCKRSACSSSSWCERNNKGLMEEKSWTVVIVVAVVVGVLVVGCLVDSVLTRWIRYRRENELVASKPPHHSQRRRGSAPVKETPPLQYCIRRRAATFT